jgi:hypothetical protein
MHGLPGYQHALCISDKAIIACFCIKNTYKRRELDVG